MNEERFVVIGKIGSTHGVKGHIKLFADGLTQKALEQYQPIYVNEKGNWQLLKIASIKPHKNGFVIKIADVDDIDGANHYRNKEVAIKRSKLPELKNDEYYWTDLEGLTVFTHDGVKLGIVDHLIETGANDVLVIKGDRVRMIPFVLNEIVLEVDLEQKRMIVEWDEEF